ncbi:hypothetical protein D3C80_1915160 [compost metagenome]
MHFKRARVDFHQQIACLDLLALGKVDRHQLAINPAGYGHGVGGGGGAQSGKIAWYRLLRDGGRLYR